MQRNIVTARFRLKNSHASIRFIRLTPLRFKRSLDPRFMSENLPETPNTHSAPAPSQLAAGTPPVAPVVPRTTEASKVQPKKETVRINLPPKPTASPTIKLPAPSSSPSAHATATSAPSGGAPTPSAPGASAPMARQAAAAAPAHVAPRAQTSMHSAASISKIDQILALAAAVVAVLALVRVLML